MQVDPVPLHQQGDGVNSEVFAVGEAKFYATICPRHKFSTYCSAQLVPGVTLVSQTGRALKVDVTVAFEGVAERLAARDQVLPAWGHIGCRLSELSVHCVQGILSRNPDFAGDF